MAGIVFFIPLFIHLTFASIFVQWNQNLGCQISINGDLGEPQPLILNPSDNSIRYSRHTDIVTFATYQFIKLGCPGSHLQVTVKDKTYNLTSLEYARCLSGTLFRIKGYNIVFSNITCVSYPEEIARLTNQTCEESNKEIEVGFQIQNTFLRSLQICFDDSNQRTLYTHFTLKPSIEGRQSGFPRPSWKSGDFYSLGDANSYYLQRVQVQTVNSLLGIENLTSTKYVNSASSYYMARGHLAAKADFVFGAEQRLTFFMVNAAPQWQTFNGANWAVLESDVRDLAIDQNVVLEVYTGTYGVMTLPHEVTGEETEIWLYKDENNNRGLPVPLLYWKFLYEPLSEAGIVIVGINNPYLEDVSDAVICKDITDEISWGTWTRNDNKNGYMYACSVDDFKRTVTYLPNVTVTSDYIV